MTLHIPQSKMCGRILLILKDGERGRKRTRNLLIKSQIGLSIYFLATHN